MDDLYSIYMFWYDSKIMYLEKIKPISSQQLIHNWTNIWFAKNEEQKKIDKSLQRYEHLINELIYYEPINLIEKIAMIILYDQITRNIYRGTPKAYSYDFISLRLCLSLINSDNYIKLPLHIKITLMICLIHSENAENQNLAKKLFQDINKFDHRNEWDILNSLKLIIDRHNDRIDLFGRIPERNSIIGRASTEKELIFLKNIY